MRNYVFEDSYSGEEFIVYCNSRNEALEEAKMYFADPMFICIFTEVEAESSGLDVY